MTENFIFVRLVKKNIYKSFVYGAVLQTRRSQFLFCHKITSFFLSCIKFSFINVIYNFLLVEGI